MQGFEVSCLLGTEPKMAEDLIGDSSLPLTLLPVQGGAADPVAVEAAVKSATGLIIAFDGEEVLSDAALDIFMPKDGTNFKHVSLLSRHLNGEGMGFFAKAAKVAANAEIWAGQPQVVERFEPEPEPRTRTRPRTRTGPGPELEPEPCACDEAEAEAEA